MGCGPALFGEKGLALHRALGHPASLRETWDDPTDNSAYCLFQHPSYFPRGRVTFSARFSELQDAAEWPADPAGGQWASIRTRPASTLSPHLRWVLQCDPYPCMQDLQQLRCKLCPVRRRDWLRPLSH